MLLLATGRDADVYDLGGGRVLRRYRRGGDTRHEAAIMRRVREAGFPVPAVHSAEGADLVMDAVRGPTMLEDLARRPWRMLAHADLLAGLMTRLHAIPVVGGSVLHGDLHPNNVILSGAGPVVIDWSASQIGPPGQDVAMTWIIVATSIPDGGAWQRAVTGLGQAAFARRFLGHFDQAAVRAALPEVAGRRLQDRNVTPRERRRVARLAGRT